MRGGVQVPWHGKVIPFGALALAALAWTALLGGAGEGAAKGSDIVVAEAGKGRIYLAELNLAMAPDKYRLERQGYEFRSDRGQSLYRQLQLNVLNNMIARMLLGQGAAEMKVVLNTAEIGQGYQEELKKRRQSETELIKELEAFGWTKALFLEDLRRRLTEERFIDRFVAPGAKADARDAAVNQWLAARADSARVRVYFQAGTGGNDILEQAEKAALKYYQSKYGTDKDVMAKATNYGCHIQVDIINIKNGKVIKSLVYSNERIYEI